MRIPDDPTTAHEANPTLGAPSFLRSARLSLNSPHQLVALALATTVLAPAGGATPSIVDDAAAKPSLAALKFGSRGPTSRVSAAVGSYMTYMHNEGHAYKVCSNGSFGCEVGNGVSLWIQIMLKLA